MAKSVKPGKLRGNTTLNALTENPNDYVLNIIGGMSYSLKDLAQLVVKSGTTTLREDQLVDGFRLITEKGIEMGLLGNNISYDYFNLRFGVKGVFDSANEAFMRPKHQVTATLSVSADVRKAMEETLVVNEGPARNYAQMDNITNTKNGDVNKTLTAGQVLDIRGASLAILGDNPNVGVYLQEETAPDSARIKASIILTNEPKHLMFMVPSNVVLDKKYRIVHVSQAGSSNSKSGTILKEPKTEYSTQLLTCVSGEGGMDRPDEI